MVELSTDLLVDLGGWPAMKEARGLVERGRVSEVKRDGPRITGRVQGAEKSYDAQIVLGERVSSVEVKCTCPESRRSGRVCAHILAVGLAALKPAAAPVPAKPVIVSPSRGEKTDAQADFERPRLVVGSRDDGALELGIENARAPGFSPDGKRLVPHAEIPAFFARDWPALERACDVVMTPRFTVAISHPEIEAKLDGSLAGVTVELAAHYGERAFSLGWKTEPGLDEIFPDSHDLFRFWRRDAEAEKQAAIAVQGDGFSPQRNGGRTFSLTTERQVARFLANTLPRWRREWNVVIGPRLESTLREVDIAEPSVSLRAGGSGEDWLSLDLQLTVAGKPVALDAAEVQRWLQTGQSHARTADRRVLLVPTEAWSEMQEVLADCAVEQEPGRMRVARTYAPYLAGALDAQGFRVARNDAVETAPPDIAVKLDPALVALLRPYQAAGVAWMAALAQRGAHGLLADDMGLGKTLQALAFCAWLRATGKTSAPTLVVCPTSLVTNWLREAARFTPHLRALDFTGSDRAARRAEISRADLVVTSYAILRRDIEQLRELDFGLVVLDEAQHIKNRGSQNAQGAKMLRARHRLILTGTPLENSVLDLWSLFDFLVPGYLGTAADFRERYETPLGRGGEPPKQMARLRQRVRPFFLRRTKEEVLPELPPKLEHATLCELTGEQREVYRAVLAQGRRDVFDNSGKQGAGRDRIVMLTTLLRLRQVCCHLRLLPAGDEPRAWREPSAKLDRTFELIDEAIDGGHRVLLFSQFVQMLHLLRDEARRREIDFCYLDGQTVDRQGEIDRFQRDAGVPLFLISLKAGGTGLNLTGADTVIHFDPWWNPAVEDQATSRAHRFGQQRAVQAYKLIAAGTVEEKIQALQARKREIFAASVGDEAFVSGLSGEEMEELLAE
jgi:superfamily II DNA or RNA helicase